MILFAAQFALSIMSGKSELERKREMRKITLSKLQAYCNSIGKGDSYHTEILRQDYLESVKSLNQL